jgi:hypothetical protein
VSIFQKSIEKIQVLLKSDKKNGYFTCKPICMYDHISLSSYNKQCFWKKKLCRKSKRIFYVQKNLFRKLCRLRYNVKKGCTDRHATSHNVVYTHWSLDTQGYKRTLRKCNTHCFSTAIIVATMHLNVTLYVKCLSFSSYGLLVAANSGIVCVLNNNPKSSLL